MSNGELSLQEQIRQILETAVTESKAPGAAAYVGDLEHTHANVAVGARQLIPSKLPAEADTIYDLASVTKVVATTTSIMLLHDGGTLDLDASIASFLPIPAFKGITVRNCLTHTAGLNPGKPFYKDLNTIDAMLERYAEIPLSWPAGSRWQYSDVSFMILGRVVEIVSKQKLDVFCANHIFKPLEMKNTTYNPPASLAARCAATEKCAWRGKVMCGEVHDENAYAVGGVSGHAGLFSTTADLATFVRALLTGKLVKPETFAAMTKIGTLPFWPWQGLGWQLDGWPTRSTGFLPTRASVGHAGWTGTSIWMDQVNRRFAILLGNTCHPSRVERDNDTFRLKFYAGISKIYYPTSTNTHPGLDRLVRESFSEARGKRAGLLTHQSALDSLGRNITDVFALVPEAKVVRLFSPEHGLCGQEEAGKTVGAQSSSIPVVSLYGERKAPTAEELKGLQLFIIDLQDVGARYYTYAATMKACLKACAQARVPVLVLDRPNPVGGVVLEGPIAVNTDSMVCWGAVPARHGMTMGEIAQFLKQTELKALSLELRISSLDSWAPDRLFNECSLTWVPPSPNIPTVETAVLYTGMCLFEGCNMNEGRGTDTPFQLIGAPWLKAEQAIAAVPASAVVGMKLEAVAYTPRSIPGRAATPKHMDAECKGIQVTLTDPRAARPFSLAVALLSAVRKLHPNEFAWEKSFDLLAGSADLRTRIDKGEGPTAIIESYSEALFKFDAARPKFYADPPSAGGSGAH